jgi:hypothetical protein
LRNGPEDDNLTGSSDRGDNPELAEVTCNVTTLAMQLLSLADGDEASLRKTAVQLLKDRGVTASTDTQLEELLRQLTIKVGGGTTVELNESTHKAWEVAWVLDETSELFASYVEKTETIEDVMTQQKYKDKVAPAVEKGAVVLLSTNLTSKCHIAKLNSILDDGLLVDDPYGCLVDGKDAYLENGMDLTQDRVDRIKNSAAVLDQRLKSNSNLRKKLSDLAEAGQGKVPGDAGKLNFFTWDEVKTYDIGKYVNITYKK